MSVIVIYTPDQRWMPLNTGITILAAVANAFGSSTLMCCELRVGA